MRVHVSTPFRTDKKLGKAYNEAFEMIPDDDWLCVIDHDVLFLTHDAVNILENYAANYPDAGLFTCFTNRIHPLAVDQLLYEKVSDITDITHHIRIAEEMRRNGAKVTSLNHPISGFLMMICKKTWSAIRFNEDLQCLGVDNDFSDKVLRSGKKILRMDALYVWHTYRLMNGITDKKHLH